MLIEILTKIGHAILWVLFSLLCLATAFIVVAIVLGIINYNPPKNNNVHHVRVARQAHTKGRQHAKKPKREIHGKFFSKHFYKASTGYGSMQATPTKQSDEHDRKLVNENAHAYINSFGNRSQYLTYTTPIKVIPMMNDRYYNDITHITETTVFFVKKNAVQPTKRGAR